MTSESKILTVSYGTFSCTLEGFDDPFNTMKAIAEYFRDLTAEDRYFGAEPPQPDAAMLHRIAEREVSRLVDARVRENGVHLRPQNGAAPKPDQPQAAPAPADVRSARDMAAKPAVDAAAAAPAEPTLQDSMPGGVAAKLARIRQSVSPQPDSAEVPVEAAAAPAEDVAPSPVDAADLVAPDQITATEDHTATVEPMDAAPADLVAAGLETVDLTPSEPEPVDFSRDALSQIDALLRAPVDATADHDTAQGLDSTRDPALEDVLPEDGPDVATSLTTAPMEDPLPETAGPEDVGTEEFVEAAATDLPVVAATPEPEKTTGRSRRVNSRIVRLHPGVDDGQTDDRSDPQATRQLSPDSEDAEVARLLRQTDDVMADDENRRRLDSIAHLKAAVVATEADRAITGETKSQPTTNVEPYRDDLAQVVQPDSEPPPRPTPEVKPRRKTVSVRPQGPRPGTIRPGMMGPPPLVLVSEQRIDRLPPAPVPTSAPIPAPVATPAAQAPREVPRDGQPAAATRTGRLTGAIGVGSAGGAAPAPQKIVLDQPSQGAAQATDAEDEEEHDEDLSVAEQAGLIDFAERVGVKSMAEMLEAAAAYATCIEKRSQFTRPQLMRRLMASAGDRQVSREDGLRSFGTLLRTGRIEKVSRGHYMLAETSPYLAEARRLS